MGRSEIACLLYADQSLKKLFNHFKKRDDFNNTIFIIMGDHGAGVYRHLAKINAHRIPLIIYSELLKKEGQFKGVCSHLDVLPSLLRLLESNFNIISPALEPFIGEGLDTSKTFKASKMIPLNIWSNDQLNFILDNLILVEKEVFEFDENFNFEICTDEVKRKRIIKAHSDYIKVNAYAVSKNKIWEYPN